MNLPESIKTAELTFVGEGNQGIVYLIDPLRCIKYYKKSKFFTRELSALQRAKGEAIFPVLYEWGENYIIREYFPGEDLETYLRNNQLTEAISRQLVEIYETFKRLRFKRLDTRLAHVIITPNRQLKIIDPTNAMNKENSFPRKLLASLDNLGLKTIFLEHTAEINSSLYEKWSNTRKRDHDKHKKPEEFVDNFLYNLFNN
jgi:predicted Ser/Thr protein kinase